MKDFNIPVRKSTRLKNYDYSQVGYYFVTICTKDKICLFGNIIDNKMILNEFGEIANNELKNTADIRYNISVDCSIVMPNHVHVIFVIHNNSNVGNADVCGRIQYAPTNRHGTLGSCAKGYKASVTSKIKMLNNAINKSILQRNYYEHIIRNEQELQKIREYITYNAMKWKDDLYYV